MDHRTRTGVLVIALVATLLVPVPTVGATTVLGSDVVLFDSNRTGNYEIYRMQDDGSGIAQLTTDPTYDSWWPKISPDRTRIMFARTPAGVHDRDYTQVSTWVMNADGTGLTEILPLGAYGWGIQGHPEWSPDGTEITTMCGPDTNSQICITDADGSDPRTVTSKEHSTQIDPFENDGRRGGMNLDPSWSPDGEHLLFVGCAVFTCWNSLYDLYRIRVDGTDEERLTLSGFRDHDPYYSPDGSQIAWIRESGHPLKWGIFVMDADGSNQRALIDDGSINSKPGWGLDSNTIWFHRWALGTTLFNVWRIDVDGTGLTEVIEPERNLGIFGEYDNEFPVNSSF